MSRFVMYCGHSEIGLRCDGEPSTLALLEAVQKALAALNVVVHSEPTPVGDHQANGTAEAMVRVLRAKANLLVQQIEESTGCPGPTFGCLHPAYSWAHSCSLVTQSLNFDSTPCLNTNGFLELEGSTVAKVALFGECVLGFLRTSLKGRPQWTRGIWLSKTTSNDCHIIFEDVDPQAISAEAGDGKLDAPADTEQPAASSGDVALDTGHSGMAHGDAAPETPVEHGEKHDAEHEVEGGAPKRSHVEGVSSSSHGDVMM
jgi:hypothetical protein